MADTESVTVMNDMNDMNTEPNPDALSDGDRWLTPDEACEYLGVKKSWLYAQTRSRTLPHVKYNGHLLRFSHRELAAWAERQRQA